MPRIYIEFDNGEEPANVNSIFNMIFEDVMERADEYRDVSGYNTNDFWSVADGIQPLSFDVPPTDPEPYEGQLFGMSTIKPKAAIVFGAFGAAATIGLRILKRN